MTHKLWVCDQCIYGLYFTWYHGHWFFHRTNWRKFDDDYVINWGKYCTHYTHTAWTRAWVNFLKKIIIISTHLTIYILSEVLRRTKMFWANIVFMTFLSGVQMGFSSESENNKCHLWNKWINACIIEILFSKIPLKTFLFGEQNCRMNIGMHFVSISSIECH